MPRFETGTVSEVLEIREGVARLTVRVGDRVRRATVFTSVTGPVEVGDRVIVNTTGIDLELGTGGEDFVLWNLERREAGEMSGGHILKMRYTPWQVDTVTAEAPESEYHDLLVDRDTINGMPVVACGLHSQVAAVVAAICRRRPRWRVAYVMTDGAALPIAHSNLVAALRERRLLSSTITCGHAFGGDLECVNVFSGLVAARWVDRADVAVVAMGPGVVGTGTAVGHTEMEQGQVLSAAAALGGRPVAALRISFAEDRPRHRVVSHHSLSALRLAAVRRSWVAVPVLAAEKLAAVMSRLKEARLEDLHHIWVVEAEETLEALREFGLEPETMGRKLTEDPEFFLAAGAAGLVAVQLAEGERS